ncbi:MAG TPA: hypothetical protein VMU07_01100 [Candidatus Paceibacterota bacterium]|nr:hypothetical protein [Candidatus Paceibacterota bacterium]
MPFRFFADIFFPRACLACRARASSFVIMHSDACCFSCFDAIPRCRMPPALIPGGAPRFYAGGASRYESLIVQHMVHSLKFKGVRAAAEPLGDLLAEYVVQAPPASTVRSFVPGVPVIPIPLSKKRERERGFNQADLIAQRFARKFNLPVENKILFRERHTKPQSETASAEERRRNLTGCFALRGAPPARVILVDDVMTTGSTFKEAAHLLFKNGTQEILALAASAVV